MDEIPDALPEKVRRRLEALPDEVGWRRLEVRRRLIAARHLHGLDQDRLQRVLNQWSRRAYYGVMATDVGGLERCTKDLTYGLERAMVELLGLWPDWFSAPIEHLRPSGRVDRNLVEDGDRREP